MVRAAGRELTLDEVEHEIVRKEFAEPRIHFALVCAALSCPEARDLLLSGRFRLRKTAYDWTLNSFEKGRDGRTR
jgi:hypothetical protein